MSEYSELYNYVRARGEYDPEFIQLTRRIYKKNARMARLLRMPMRFLEKPNPEAKYTFLGSRLQELVLSLPRNEVQILGSPLDWKFCRKYDVPFQSTTDAWPVVSGAMASWGESPQHERDLEKYLIRFSPLLRGYVVSWADGPPVERLLMLAARRAGLRTIQVQHGIFHRKYAINEIDGQYADCTFAIDAYQKQLLIEKGIPAGKIHIMGFHSTLPGTATMPTLRSGRNRKACFIGQPYPKWAPAWGGEPYLKLVRDVRSVLLESGFELTYKPHPFEMSESYFREFPPVFTGSMNEALAEFDVFISLTSTALFEATICGRIAIQIDGTQFVGDNFSLAGYAHSLDVAKLASLPVLIESALPFENQRLVELSTRPVVERFQKTLAAL